LGECIHFIDYAIWCCGVPVAVTARALPDVGRYRRDNLAMTISFEDGSIAQILYCANGDRGLGKERIEAHAGGRSAVIDDFRRLELHGARGRRVRRAYLRQDKGHTGEWVAFTRAIRRGGGSPTPFNEVRAGMVVAFAAQDSLADGQPRMLGCTGDV
jgi:polar amino acid transport system substrate-binding protein